jgi:hypothetical protein
VLTTNTHAAADASSVRHSSRPLFSEGGNSRQNSCETGGEIAKLRRFTIVAAPDHFGFVTISSRREFLPVGP